MMLGGRAEYTVVSSQIHSETRMLIDHKSIETMKRIRCSVCMACIKCFSIGGRLLNRQHFVRTLPFPIQRNEQEVLMSTIRSARQYERSDFFVLLTTLPSCFY